MHDIQTKGSAGKNFLGFLQNILKTAFKRRIYTIDTNTAIFSKIRVLFVYFQRRQEKSPTLSLSSCTPKLIHFLKRGWYNTNFFFRIMSKFSRNWLATEKAELHMTSSCHIGVTDNDRNRYRMWAYQNNSPCSWC